MLPVNEHQANLRTIDSLLQHGTTEKRVAYISITGHLILVRDGATVARYKLVEE